MSNSASVAVVFDKALTIVRAHRPPLQAEEIPLQEALGKLITEPATAQIDSPPFDNASMDGFAVNGPGPWRVVGEVPPGSPVPPALTQATAIRIFTGAPTPPNTFAVLPQEVALLEGNRLTTEKPPRDGLFIRRQGEVFQAGQPLIQAGERINPANSALLTAAGVSQVKVTPNPKIAYLVTGNEIVPPGEPLRPGAIYDANQTGLQKILEQMRMDFWSIRTATDYEASLRRELAVLIPQTDLLLTTGGVSVGAYDLVPKIMAEFGFQTHFSKLTVRPGQPTHFATHPDGKAWFGLPGNPLSALTMTLLLVLPYLHQELKPILSPLAEAVERTSEREEFLPAIQSPKGVKVFPPIGSHSLNDLAKANCLARLSPPKTQFEACEQIEIYWLPWGSL